MDKLRDIKGLIAIDDYSLYIFIATVICLFLFFYWFLKFLWKFLKRDTSIKIAKRELKALDLGDSKKSAYTITKYAPYLKKEEDFSYLQKYKYKKESLEFSKEDRERVERFLKDV